MHRVRDLDGMVIKVERKLSCETVERQKLSCAVEFRAANKKTLVLVGWQAFSYNLIQYG